MNATARPYRSRKLPVFSANTDALGLVLFLWEGERLALHDRWERIVREPRRE